MLDCNQSMDIFLHWTYGIGSYNWKQPKISLLKCLRENCPNQQAILVPYVL